MDLKNIKIYSEFELNESCISKIKNYYKYNYNVLNINESKVLKDLVGLLKLSKNTKSISFSQEEDSNNLFIKENISKLDINLNNNVFSLNKNFYNSNFNTTNYNFKLNTFKNIFNSKTKTLGFGFINKINYEYFDIENLLFYDFYLKSNNRYGYGSGFKVKSINNLRHSSFDYYYPNLFKIKNKHFINNEKFNLNYFYELSIKNIMNLYLGFNLNYINSNNKFISNTRVKYNFPIFRNRPDIYKDNSLNQINKFNKNINRITDKDDPIIFDNLQFYFNQENQINIYKKNNFLFYCFNDFSYLRNDNNTFRNIHGAGLNISIKKVGLSLEIYRKNFNKLFNIRAELNFN